MNTPMPGPSDTEEPTVTATNTLPPIQATVQALSDSIRIPTADLSTPVADGSIIAPDDYPVLLERSCQIVRDHYVRDDFNGVDWDAACEDYMEMVAEIDSQAAFWDLMEAFIAELGDNHSRFVRPERFDQEFNLALPGEGSLRAWPGFVIWPAREDERLMLWNVCRAGPAANAGLSRGDIVTAINGEPVPMTDDGFDGSEINRLLYAGESMSVSLTVQRGPNSAPATIELEYGSASGCDGWVYGLIQNNPRIGYIRVPNFGGDSDTNMLNLIERMEEDTPLDGLILDVRHNPGGNSDRDISIFTSGVFGKTGPLREDATQTIYRIRGPVKWNETTPVAVLIDGNSHSASEYFATAMQQSSRAVLVGMPTAGNTEGITGFGLSDGSLIRLAFTTLQLPDGTTLEGVGVTPNIIVPLGEWGLRAVPDVQLQAALEALGGG